MKRLVVALVLLLAVAFSASTASAAKLNLSGTPSVSATRALRCDSAVAVTTATTSGTSSSVVVSGIVAACSGLTLEVRMWDSASSSVKFTGSGTVPTGATSMTVTGTPAFTPTASLSANVMIAAWPIPATWSYTPPTPPLVSCATINGAPYPCTATLQKLDKWGSPFTNYNAYFVVSSTNPNATTEWRITINLADSALPFVPVAMSHNNASELAPGWRCSARPQLVLDGQAGSSTATVGGGTTVTVYLAAATSGSGDLFTCP